VDKILIPLSHKVDAIVNYDNFEIEPDLVGEYTDTVKNIVETYYTSVTRYTASTFLRMKLGEALKERNVASHIYESMEEARQALKK
jgi:propionate CoA-transferase